MLTLARDLWHDETGVTTIETAVMLALVAAVALLAWRQLGHEACYTAPEQAVATRPS